VRNIGWKSSSDDEDVGVVTNIYLNGEERVFESGTTLSDLVRLFPIASGVAIARNGEVVPKSAWHSTQIEPLDRFEVLSVAPGG
jgi:sulfur carrier protein